VNAPTPPDDPALPWTERRLAGLTLADYTSVRAGVSEGFSLERVLAAEGIAPEAWPQADDAWGDALLESDDEAAVDAHDELLWQARQRYARQLPPVDRELAPWLDVVRGFASDPEPLAFLARIGLRAADMMRLHRLWSERLADQPALREEALAILSAAPAAPPQIEARPAQLPAPITVRVFGEEGVEDEVETEDENDEVRLPSLPPPLFVRLPASAARAPETRRAHDVRDPRAGAEITAESPCIPGEPALPFAGATSNSGPAGAPKAPPGWPFGGRRPGRSGS
jgi:hypothetical protein